MQADLSPTSILLTLLVPIIGVLFVAGFVWFLGFASGWRDLAKAFPGRTPANPTADMVGSIRIDMAEFAPVRIRLSAEGLHLDNFLQPGAVSVFIPWNELHERYEEGWLWKKKVSFAVGTPRKWRLAVSTNVFKQPPPIPSDGDA